MIATIYRTVAADFEAARDQFAQNFARQGDYREVGASFVAFHKRICVADLWGGHCDAPRTRPWERDTLANIWSATKGHCRDRRGGVRGARARAVGRICLDFALKHPNAYRLMFDLDPPNDAKLNASAAPPRARRPDRRSGRWFPRRRPRAVRDP